MTFLVEVTHQHAADDRDDGRVECQSIDDLAREIDDAAGLGIWTALEIAADVARGQDFNHEDIETGRTVEARAVEQVEV